MAKYRTLGEIGEYYQTAHLLRPVRPNVVDDYARAMKDGSEFGPIHLGEFRTEDGVGGKLIVDGVHAYRAAQVAKVAKLQVTISQFDSLSDALAAQLKANVLHGLRVTPEQRDVRIRMLVEVHNWTVRRIAEAVGLHYSSVSRVVNKKQNRSGTGKTGPKRGVVVAHALPPTQFFRTVENIHLTLGKAQSRTMILAAIHDPKQVQKMPRVIATLQSVSTEINLLLKLATEAIAESEAAAG